MFFFTVWFQKIPNFLFIPVFIAAVAGGCLFLIRFFRKKEKMGLTGIFCFSVFAAFFLLCGFQIFFGVFSTRYILPLSLFIILGVVFLFERAEAFLRCFLHRAAAEKIIFAAFLLLLLSCFCKTFFNRRGEKAYALQSAGEAIRRDCEKNAVLFPVLIVDNPDEAERLAFFSGMPAFSVSSFPLADPKHLQFVKKAYMPFSDTMYFCFVSPRSMPSPDHSMKLIFSAPVSAKNKISVYRVSEPYFRMSRVPASAGDAASAPDNLLANGDFQIVNHDRKYYETTRTVFRKNRMSLSSLDNPDFRLPSAWSVQINSPGYRLKTKSAVFSESLPHGKNVLRVISDLPVKIFNEKQFPSGGFTLRLIAEAGRNSVFQVGILPRVSPHYPFLLWKPLFLAKGEFVQIETPLDLSVVRTAKECNLLLQVLYGDIRFYLVEIIPEKDVNH